MGWDKTKGKYYFSPLSHEGGMGEDNGEILGRTSFPHRDRVGGDNGEKSIRQ